MALNYKISYIPSTNEQKILKYTCVDKKIHIRFKDYTEPQIICGLVDKLTYLITYIMNKEIVYKYFMMSHSRETCKFKSVWNYYVSQLENSVDYQNIISKLGFINHIGDYKGVKLYPNYKRNGYKNPMSQFGSMDVSNLVLSDDRGTLDIFLSKINWDLENFLTNDDIVIELFDDTKIRKVLTKRNKKLENKISKISEKPKQNLKSLWDF